MSLTLSDLRSGSTGVENLVNCAAVLCSELSSKWEGRGAEKIEWEVLVDMAYWRFCRYASWLNGELIEKKATPEQLSGFKDTLDQFTELTEDMLQVASDSPDFGASLLERLKNSHDHCKERGNELGERIKKEEEACRKESELAETFSSVVAAT
jgi:hypothetical protein